MPPDGQSRVYQGGSELPGSETRELPPRRERLGMNAALLCIYHVCFASSSIVDTLRSVRCYFIVA